MVILLNVYMEYNITYYIVVGDLESIKKLVESGCDINITYKYDRTLLHMSSLNNCLDVVKYLVEQGVDINSKDVDCFTPLHIASLRHHTKIIEYLLSKGADPYVKNVFGRTSIDLSYNKEEFLNLIRLTKLNKIYGE